MSKLYTTYGSRRTCVVLILVAFGLGLSAHIAPRAVPQVPYSAVYDEAGFGLAEKE